MLLLACGVHVQGSESCDGRSSLAPKGKTLKWFLNELVQEELANRMRLGDQSHAGENRQIASMGTAQWASSLPIGLYGTC